MDGHKDQNEEDGEDEGKGQELFTFLQRQNSEKKCLFAHSVCGRSGLFAHTLCGRSGLFAHSPGFFCLVIT